MNKADGYIWAEKNKELYLNLEPETIYYVFENEEPTVDGDLVYRTKYIYDDNGKLKERIQTGYSKETGNKYICKIAICKCGNLVASSRLRSAWCNDCLHEKSIRRMSERYSRVRTVKPKKVKKQPSKKEPTTAKEIARSITDKYQKVFRRESEYNFSIYDEIVMGV